MLPIKMNVHLTQHLKGISITKTELLADVGQRHSFPYTGAEYFSSQRILVNVYLVTNSIDAHYLSFAAIVSQTFPKSRAQILRVVATVRFYEDVRIQHEQEASRLYQDDVPIFSDIFSKTSPFKPVRLHASR